MLDTKESFQILLFYVLLKYIFNLDVSYLFR